MTVAPRRLEFVWVTSLACNADCTYCFQNKDGSTMSLADARRVVLKLRWFLEHGTERMNVYFQGGDAMTLPPEWYEAVIRFGQQMLGGRVTFHMQSNLLAYNKSWGDLLKRHLRSTIGSSLDWPNLFRRTGHVAGEEYNRLWKEKFDEATADGIRVGVISLPNVESVRIGARAFLDYYVHQIGLRSLQINFLFVPDEQIELPDPVALGGFMADLVDESKRYESLSLRQANGLRSAFLGRSKKSLYCVHSPNCAAFFLSVRPDGMASLCDSWIAFRPHEVPNFGNLLADDLPAILASQKRRELLARAFRVVSGECLACEYLAFCHGGCPVRAFRNRGALMRKDYYCEAYKILFERAEEEACAATPTS